MNSMPTDKIVANPISAHADNWLELFCKPCGGRTVQYPIKMLIMAYGGERLLGEVVTRLRCQNCRNRPSTIALKEHILEVGFGRTKGWFIDLTPNISAPAPLAGNGKP